MRIGPLSMVIVSALFVPAAAADAALESFKKDAKEAIVKQVSFCKVAHGFVKAPCTGKLLGEKILPFLHPIEISGLRASQTIIDLDTGNWVSKARSWINKGLDWLGIPDRYRIPSKIGYDFALGMKLSDLKFSMPKGKEYQPEFGAKIDISIKVMSKGPFEGKKFSPGGSATGRLYVTVVPYGKDCTERKVDWTMAVLHMELTGLKVKGLPAWLTDNKLVLGILNWGLNKVYDDYPQYGTRGIAVCLDGKCPGKGKAEPASAPEPKKEGVLKLGGASGGNKYIGVTLRKDGTKKIEIKDHNLFCDLGQAVLNSGCTDAFVNAMANTVLPLSVPVPERYAGPGLSVSADKFTLAIDAKNHVALETKVGLRKKGEAEAFGVTLGASVRLRPMCTQKRFMMVMTPQIDAVRMTPLPGWLTNRVLRAAVNSNLKPMAFCFDSIKIKQLGKRINVCEVTDALFQEKCTGPFINALAGSVFPLRVRPSHYKDIEKVAPNLKLKTLLSGIQVGVEKASVALAPGKTKSAKIGVEVSVAKDGQSSKLVTGGTATFLVRQKCGRDKNLVEVSPHVDELRISPIPQWLLDATIVNLGNATIGKDRVVCMGDCPKTAPVAPPATAAKKPAAAKPECSYATFQGGK